jgi:hypothetical protein
MPHHACVDDVVIVWKAKASIILTCRLESHLKNEKYKKVWMKFARAAQNMQSCMEDI